MKPKYTHKMFEKSLQKVFSYFFVLLLLPIKTSMTTVCDDSLDYCIFRRNFDMWVAGWHVTY